MCDLKSFSFSHHFGSGFKYFSATIIRKLSKILNLRLSGSDENGPASPRCGYWGNWGFFYSAPQDLWCWESSARAFLLGRLVSFLD